jgi:hypothetical protein
MLGVAHDADASTVNGLVTAPLPPPCSDSCTDVVGPFANNPATPTCAAASVLFGRMLFGRLCDGEILNSNNWPASVTCQQSCADVGHNYADPPCCTSQPPQRPPALLSPPSPSPPPPSPSPPSSPPHDCATPLDFVLVLDESGSMKGAMDGLKAFAKELVRHYSPPRLDATEADRA